MRITKQRYQPMERIVKIKALKPGIITVLTITFIGLSQFTYSQGWYNSSWAYRKAITIDFTKVPNTDQANFPVLVNLSSDAGLSAHALNSGNDILFTSSDGTTKIPYERENYISGTGALVAWVKVAALSHTVNTIIYIYYGNPGATDQQDITSNVWDANFKGVYHLKELASPSSNSGSTAGAGGTWNANCNAATGQVNGALNFSGSAGEDNVASAFGLTTTSATIECWANISSTTTLHGAFVKIGNNLSTAGNNNGVALGIGGTGANGFFFDNPGSSFAILYEGVRWINTGATFTTGWHHVVVTVNAAGRASAYLDGTLVLNETTGNNPPIAPTVKTQFGGYTGSAGEQRHFNGTLDEIRISGNIRSADWIRTEFNNQNSPSTFYALGVETVLPTITLGTISGICAGSTSFTIPYTATTGSPDQYSISGAGITTVTNGALGASPITVNLSSPAGAGSISFTLTVRNSAAGVVSANVPGSVTVNALPVSTVTNQTNITCFSANDGNITVSASGGAGPYTFSVDNGANFLAPTGANLRLFTGLLPNTAYRIKVKDNNGCISK